jgi:hypothetical protein
MAGKLRTCRCVHGKESKIERGKKIGQREERQGRQGTSRWTPRCLGHEQEVATVTSRKPPHRSFLSQ